MGREIRKVIPNWEHPMKDYPNHRTGTMKKGYQPMFDQSFKEAIKTWISDFEAWERGERPSYCSEENKNIEFWEWEDGPPQFEYYRPEWRPEEMTWFQVYETVSEGTPVTPPFSTKEELVEYLVANGDFWDQKRRAEGNAFMRCTPWTRQEAEAFVGAGHSMTMVSVGGKVMDGVEFLAMQAEEPTQ